MMCTSDSMKAIPGNSLFLPSLGRLHQTQILLLPNQTFLKLFWPKMGPCFVVVDARKSLRIALVAYYGFATLNIVNVNILVYNKI